jgi:DNA repair photolyase
MPEDHLNERQSVDVGLPAELLARMDERFRPVWSDKPPEYQRALAQYFLPRKSKKAVLSPTRPRVLKWYCPFAHQKVFPSGHRYCINVYTGCAHACEYCYAASYEPAAPSVKRQFGRMLAMDLLDLDACDVPPAPVHLSNSTDPFQPLEDEAGHTRLALEGLLGRRHRFTTVVILTKNPKRIVDLGYCDLLRQLGRLPDDHPRRDEFERTGRPAVLVEVSLAFWREDARRLYDPGAPSVDERVEGLRGLRDAGIALVLRIDPLFPGEPLGGGEGVYSDYGLVEPQILDDLEQLVLLAHELNVQHVVYSPAKVVQPRGRQLSPVMHAMRKVYQYVSAPRRPVFRGGSWRLPPDLQDAVTSPLKEMCRRHGIRTKCCMQNLIETP